MRIVLMMCYRMMTSISTRALVFGGTTTQPIGARFSSFGSRVSRAKAVEPRFCWILEPGRVACALISLIPRGTKMVSTTEVQVGSEEVTLPNVQPAVDTKGVTGPSFNAVEKVV